MLSAFERPDRKWIRSLREVGQAMNTLDHGKRFRCIEKQRWNCEEAPDKVHQREVQREADPVEW